MDIQTGIYRNKEMEGSKSKTIITLLKCFKINAIESLSALLNMLITSYGNILYQSLISLINL